MEKREKVLLISIIVLVGFVLGVFYHYVLGFYLRFPAPFNSFLLHPADVMCDFYRLFPDLVGFAPYLKGKFGQSYFPLSYLILTPFAYMKNVLFSYFLFSLFFIVPIIYWNKKIVTCDSLTKLENFQNIFIMSVLPYPLLFLLDRGNFDMVIFVFFAGFLFAFYKEKYSLSAFLLGLINAMKPFSALFIFLFLFRKKYKEFFLSLGVSFLFIAGGFLIFKGDIFEQIASLIKGIIWFKRVYGYEVTHNFGMGFGSSLYMPLKLFFCKLSSTPIISIFLLDKIYSVFSFFISIMTLFFTWREKIFWKQVTLLTCNMLLLPYYMEDYKLIFLFVPIWLFFLAKEKSKTDVFYAVLFGLLFIPKNIMIVTPHLSNTQSPFFSISIIINPLVMLFLMMLIIFEQYKGNEKEKIN